MSLWDRLSRVVEDAPAPSPVPAAEAAGFAAMLLRERDAALSELNTERRRNARLCEDILALRQQPKSEQAMAWKRSADQDRANCVRLEAENQRLRQEKEDLEHQLAWITGRSDKEPVS